MSWFDEARQWARSKYKPQEQQERQEPTLDFGELKLEPTGADEFVGPDPRLNQNPSEPSKFDMAYKGQKVNSFAVPETPGDAVAGTPDVEGAEALASAPAVAQPTAEGGADVDEAEVEAPEPPVPAEAPAPARARPPQSTFAPIEQPADETGKWAALKGLANGGGWLKPLLGVDPDTSYEDTMMKREGQKQADWKEAVKAQLKNKFDQEQQDRKLFSQEGVATANRDAANIRSQNAISASNERSRLAREQAKTIADRTDTRLTTNADQNTARYIAQTMLPQAGTIQAAQNVEKLLRTNTVPKSLGAVFTALRGVAPEEWDRKAEGVIQANIPPQDREAIRQYMKLAIANSFELGGKQLTGTEFKLTKFINGWGAGQGPESFLRGMKELADAVKERAKRAYMGRTPGVQRILEQGGLDPSWFGEVPHSFEDQ